MNLRLAALLSVFGLSLFGSLPSADAGVKGLSYDVVGITTQLQFISDTYDFVSDGTLTTDAAQGTYYDIDLSVIDIWFADLTGSENFTLSLTGLQISTFIIAEGLDSSGATYYIFGTQSQGTGTP